MTYLLDRKVIERKLYRLLEVQKAHTPSPPKICPSCGRSDFTFCTSWGMMDYPYISGEINALKWVLELVDYLMEDHT